MKYVVEVEEPVTSCRGCFCSQLDHYHETGYPIVTCNLSGTTDDPTKIPDNCPLNKVEETLVVKPCPRCHHKNLLIDFNLDCKDPCWYVLCFDCGHEINSTISSFEAIKLWNEATDA